MTGVLVKTEDAQIDAETHRQKMSVRRWKQRLEGGGHKPRDTCSPEKLEEAARTLPWSHQREHRSVETLTVEFRPIKCQRKKLRCFNPLGMWSFVMTVPGS